MRPGFLICSHFLGGSKISWVLHTAIKITRVINGPSQRRREKTAFLCVFPLAVDKLHLSWLGLGALTVMWLGWLSARSSLHLKQGNWPWWLILKRKKESGGPVYLTAKSFDSPGPGDLHLHVGAVSFWEHSWPVYTWSLCLSLPPWLTVPMDRRQTCPEEEGWMKWPLTGHRFGFHDNFL